MILPVASKSGSVVRVRPRASKFPVAKPSGLMSDWWQAMQTEIASGRMVEVLSYSEAARFHHAEVITKR